MPCRINRRKVWAHRMMLEAAVHEFSSFWTFTYDDAHIPPDGSLRPRDPVLFLKRLRKACSPRVIRYFLCGEYGDETFRPHYHAILFGVATLDLPTVQSCWPHGHVFAGTVTSQSCAYVAGYVTKKMTRKWDPRLNGKYPEFARMSLRPGIGAVSVELLSQDLQTKTGSLLLARTGDVPVSLMHGKSSQPLGRYMRRKLRENLGFETCGGQPIPAYKRAVEMQALCLAEGGVAKAREKLRRVNQVKMDQMEGRAKIFKERKTL